MSPATTASKVLGETVNCTEFAISALMTLLIFSAIFFFAINMVGVKFASILQVIMFFVLIAALLTYIVFGIPAIDPANLARILEELHGAEIGQASEDARKFIAEEHSWENAIGLVTTHDLALAEIADALGDRAANVHFEDHIENGRMVFDFVCRPGRVTRSNALELMRSVGLDV